MSEFQKGFSILMVLCFMMLSYILMFKQFEHLQALSESYFLWKRKNNDVEKHFMKWTLLNKNPCLLLCQPQCFSSELWKGEYAKGYIYQLRPLKKNNCLQKHALKMDHSIVSWRMIENL
jgi:hypothetical protein